MKKSILSLLVLPLATLVHAETFSVDTGHAEIGFSVKHLMVSNIKGQFKTFEGTVEFDMATGSLVSIKGSINASSIDTNNDKRDNHLRNADFFDVAQYPKLEFKSTEIKKTGTNTYEVTGTLKVIGVDRKVVLPVTLAGPVDDPWGNKRIGLSSEAVLNRRDLGINNSPAAVIGDEVKITIDAEAVFK